MICHKCSEDIQPGEACIVEPSDNPRHNWFFHVGCHLEWRLDRQRKEQDLLQKVNGARRVC